jgi:hypothetical protein
MLLCHETEKYSSNKTPNINKAVTSMWLLQCGKAVKMTGRRNLEDREENERIILK